MHPAAAHFARSPPPPNSTSSGCAPIARAEFGGVEIERHRRVVAGGWLSWIVCSHVGSTSRREGWARSAGVSTSSDRSGSARTSTAIPADARAIAWARCRRNDPRTVGGRDRRTRRERHHVGAVSSPVGDEADVAVAGDQPEVVGPGQVGVRDDEVVDALLGDLFDAVVDRTVQAEAAAPDHIGTLRLGPLGDLVVVAGHERRMRPSGREHPGRHPARRTGRAGRCRACRRAGPWPRGTASRERARPPALATTVEDTCAAQWSGSVVRASGAGRAASRPALVDTVWTCRPPQLAPSTRPRPA